MRHFSQIIGPFFLAYTLLSSSVSAQVCTNTTTTGAKQIASTVLVFARDATTSYTATSGLNAHGIPYQLVLVPQTGVTLPTLNSTATKGNYGGIIVLSEVSYGYTDGTGWHSALTTDQMQTMYDYQTAFGVRMVRIDVYPNVEFGTTTAIASTGCCNAGVEQLVSFSDVSSFPTAQLKAGAGISTAGLYHYPAVITDSSIAKEVAQFAPSSDGQFATTTTAAVINTFTGGRQQFVWFTSFATDWSQTSAYLQHAHIHWMTRGLFLGRRRIYFSTQVDDVQLSTYVYEPAGDRFRLRPTDLDNHVAWMKDINTRLPAGSKYVMELGHNGNGNIEWAIDSNYSGVCDPAGMISLDQPADPPLEFQKALGTGTSLWPTTPTTYPWTLACAKQDTLLVWFLTPANRDAYFHISHTFTHENENNATYSDIVHEITWNQAWLKQVGLDAGVFSSKGLIPPAITGLHNGDAIKAWMDNGITAAMGDNSRPPLRNTDNEHWPLISNVANNGYAGLTIMPRWSLPIYYNCAVASCTLDEWVNTSGGSGDFNYLLQFSKTTYTRSLFALRHDAFMFHQANLRTGDVDSFTVGSVTGTLSLLQIWTEVITQEMSRLTNWPLITLKHDDLATDMRNRMTRDACAPLLSWTLSADGKSISGASLTTTSNTCSVPIPVTFPGPATADGNGAVTSEQVGSDPLTLWATMSGSQRSFTFGSPIAL
ncbi:hypothetical protein BT63DRAFT_410307 [Microthyrium microscopicum]|uniref:Extracellular serine-rich protein n=1 Tax=Microthyrium microscopicum TaxID=703497 RepID=A0A6A6UP86_9PEZI|nr:hypothetical protein BT63DRAFT_410307 [Microthyrium microscopicum]